MNAWGSGDTWIVVVAVLSAGSCALVGNYLVLRKLSLMGDAISHAVLPGLAIAFILSESRATWPMFIGAVIVGAITALLTQWITDYGKVEHGAAMGVVFSILFAVGLILIRRAADHVDLDPGCVLYGNIVQVPLDAIDGIPPVAVRIGFVFLLNCLFVGLFYKELRISAFDPDLANAVGINASVMHYALMVMVAITAVANFEAVGSILVIAMFIVPGVAAHLLTDRLGTMIAASLAIAFASGIGGHVLAAFGPGWLGYDMSADSAGMMTVVAGLLLVLAIFLSPSQGIVARTWRRAALALTIVRQDILGLLFRWRERAGDARPIPHEDVVNAVGNNMMTRWAIRQLRRRREIIVEHAGGNGPGLRLAPAGVASAARLIGGHRLWEAYLDKHFQLAADHLHAPAERMEHYITPEIHKELRDQLTDPSHDPHGKPIPGSSPEN